MKFTIAIAALAAVVLADPSIHTGSTQSIAQSESQFDNQELAEELSIFHQTEENASEDDIDDDDDNTMMQAPELVNE